MEWKHFTKVIVFSLAMMLLSMSGNVLFHEASHYIVADRYGTNPEMHFNNDITSDAVRLFTSDVPVAYVSYDSPAAEITQKDAIIAAFGPLANIAISAVAVISYMLVPKPKRGWKSTIGLFMFVVPGIISAIVNLLPINLSDGFVMFSYLI